MVEFKRDKLVYRGVLYSLEATTLFEKAIKKTLLVLPEVSYNMVSVDNC